MVTLLERPTHEFANRASVAGDKLAQAPQVDQAGMQLQQVADMYIQKAMQQGKTAYWYLSRRQQVC